MTELSCEERAVVASRISELDIKMDIENSLLDPVTILEWAALFSERRALAKLLSADEDDRTE